MNVTQNQIDSNNLQLRNKYVRLEILDFNLKTIDTIEAECIGGSLQKDANSNLRRSGNIQIAVPTYIEATNILDLLDGFVIDLGGKIWLDKYIKIFIGIEDYLQEDNPIVWNNFGICLIDQPVRTFSASRFEISFNIVDLMAKLTGERQGQLTGLVTEIEAGYYTTDIPPAYVQTKTTEALRSVIEELSGFTKFSIATAPSTLENLPYDIKVEVGSTVYDIIEKFMNILSTWQIYFDNDGVIVIEPIPSGKKDIVFPFNEEYIVSDDLSVDFRNVKNQVVVYGRANTLNYVSTSVVYDSNTLKLYYTALDESTFTIKGTNFGFESPNSYNAVAINQVKIYVDSVLTYTCPLVDFENSTSSIATNKLQPNELYFIRIYSADLNTDETVDMSSATFEFMGKQAVSWTLVDENINSPFYVNQGLSTLYDNYYCGLAYGLGTNYKITLNNTVALTSLTNKTILTFMANQTNLSNATVTVVDGISGSTLLSAKYIKQNYWNGSTRDNIVSGKLSNDYTIWQLQYDSVNDWFVLLGRTPTVITQVFSGGEYDNIYADQLAYERCLWELYLHTNLNNSIVLGCVPNYALDVNMKIPYDKNWAIPPIETTIETQLQYFLTKQITYPLGVSSTTQNITAVEIYDSGNLLGD